MKYLLFVFFLCILPLSVFAQENKKWKVSDTTLSVLVTKDTLGQNMYLVCHVKDSTCVEILHTYTGDSVPAYAVKELFVRPTSLVKIDTLGEEYKKKNIIEDHVNMVVTVAYLEKETGKIKTKEKKYSQRTRISNSGWVVIGSAILSVGAGVIILASQAKK